MATVARNLEQHGSYKLADVCIYNDDPNKFMHHAQCQTCGLMVLISEASINNDLTACPSSHCRQRQINKETSK